MRRIGLREIVLSTWLALSTAGCGGGGGGGDGGGNTDPEEPIIYDESQLRDAAEQGILAAGATVLKKDSTSDPLNVYDPLLAVQWNKLDILSEYVDPVSGILTFAFEVYTSGDNQAGFDELIYLNQNRALPPLIATAGYKKADGTLYTIEDRTPAAVQAEVTNYINARKTAIFGSPMIMANTALLNMGLEAMISSDEEADSFLGEMDDFYNSDIAADTFKEVQMYDEEMRKAYASFSAASTVLRAIHRMSSGVRAENADLEGDLNNSVNFSLEKVHDARMLRAIALQSYMGAMREHLENNTTFNYLAR